MRVGRGQVACALLLLVAACDSNATARDGDVGPTTSPTTPAPAGAAVEPADEVAEATAPVESDPPKVPRLMSGPAALEIAFLGPPALADRVALVNDGVDLFAAQCVTTSHAPARTGGHRYRCDQLDPGAYEVGLAGPTATDVVVSTACTTSTSTSTDGRIALPIDDPLATCVVYASPNALIVELPGRDIRPADLTILAPDGERLRHDCDYSADGDRGWVECLGLPFGTYELPTQVLTEGGEEQPFVCSPGYDIVNGPGLDRTATLSADIGEQGVPANVWTCHGDVPWVDLPGAAEIRVQAPPRWVDDVDVSFTTDGTDLFDTHCEVSEPYHPAFGVVYTCSDLPRVVYEISAELDAAATVRATCSPGSPEPKPVDLAFGVSALCYVNAWPPGIQVVLFGGVASQPFDPAGFTLLAGDGTDVGDVCDPYHDDETVWLFCFPLPHDTYRVPTQPVRDGGPEQPFVCSPDLGLDSGPGLDDTATLSDDVTEWGGRLDVWSCIGEEPIGEPDGIAAPPD